MKRTIAVAALLAGALALTASSAVEAQTHRHGPHGKRGNSMSFSFGMHQGRLGAQVTSMTPALRKHFGAPSRSGLLVGKVQPNSAAAKAGLKVGDVIVKVDGRNVDQPWDVMTALSAKKKGDKVTIDIVRNKRMRSLQATMLDNGWGMPNIATFGKGFGNFGHTFGRNLGKNWSKQAQKFLGKDFDIIIKGLNNGNLNLGTLRRWSKQPSKNDLARKLKDTMKRVLELEKALKKMQKTK